MALRKTYSRETAKIGLTLNGKQCTWQATCTKSGKSQLGFSAFLLAGVAPRTRYFGIICPEVQSRASPLFLREQVLRFWTFLFSV